MSTNYAAIAPVVRSGQAISVLPRAVVDAASQRVLGPKSGLPAGDVGTSLDADHQFGPSRGLGGHSKARRPPSGFA